MLEKSNSIPAKNCHSTSESLQSITDYYLYQNRNCDEKTKDTLNSFDGPGSTNAKHLWVSATSKWEGDCEYAGDKQGKEANNIFVMHNALPWFAGCF